MINNIKKMRLRKGYTQQEVADILGISREHFNRIERGINIPSVKLALSIKRVLWNSLFDNPFFLDGIEEYELDQRIKKILEEHEDWSPDIPLDEFDS